MWNIVETYVEKMCIHRADSDRRHSASLVISDTFGDRDSGDTVTRNRHCWAQFRSRCDHYRCFSTPIGLVPAGTTPLTSTPTLTLTLTIGMLAFRCGSSSGPLTQYSWHPASVQHVFVRIDACVPTQRLATHTLPREQFAPPSSDGPQYAFAGVRFNFRNIRNRPFPRWFHAHHTLPEQVVDQTPSEIVRSLKLMLQTTFRHGQCHIPARSAVGRVKQLG